MNLLPIITNALVFGVVLASILFAMILVVVRINPEIMLRDYPPDVQAEHGPMRDRSRRLRLLVATLVLAVIFGVIIASLTPIRDDAIGGRLFPTIFVHFFVMLTVFNVLDWLVLDWLIVVTIRPSFLVFPGTEDMAGYRDYAFHFRGFSLASRSRWLRAFSWPGLSPSCSDVAPVLSGARQQRTAGRLAPLGAVGRTGGLPKSLSPPPIREVSDA